MSNLVWNFTSNIIAELCTLFGVQQVRTTPYHSQSKGKTEMFHQTLTQMISKLNSEYAGWDEKANWPSHLPELIQAYNGTRSAIMGYNLYYLMFGRKLRFPVDMYFPLCTQISKLIMYINTSLPSTKA